MVFTLSKELIQDVIEKKKNNVVHEEIIVKDNSEEKYILKYNKKYIDTRFSCKLVSICKYTSFLVIPLIFFFCGFYPMFS